MPMRWNDGCRPGAAGERRRRLADIHHRHAIGFASTLDAGVSALQLIL